MRPYSASTSSSSVRQVVPPKSGQPLRDRAAVARRGAARHAFSATRAKFQTLLHPLCSLATTVNFGKLDRSDSVLDAPAPKHKKRAKLVPRKRTPGIRQQDVGRVR